LSRKRSSQKSVQVNPRIVVREATRADVPQLIELNELAYPAIALTPSDFSPLPAAQASSGPKDGPLGGQPGKS
jgi:hypothetical protein